MAPWTPRAASSNSQGYAIGDTRTSFTPSREGGRPRLTDEDILNQAYGIPSLQPSGPEPLSLSNHLRQAGTSSGHGRSMSHPFPTLFQGKKQEHEHKAGAMFDSTDEDQHISSVSSNTRSNRIREKNLMTGKCMTCNSLVRWPKELMVFRCTVCMTINDLKSRYSDHNSGTGKSAPNMMISEDKAQKTMFLKG